MKLFEQPLDKLFSPKALKQLNQAICAAALQDRENACRRLKFSLWHAQISPQTGMPPNAPLSRAPSTANKTTSSSSSSSYYFSSPLSSCSTASTSSTSSSSSSTSSSSSCSSSAASSSSLSYEAQTKLNAIKRKRHSAPPPINVSAQLRKFSLDLNNNTNINNNLNTSANSNGSMHAIDLLRCPPMLATGRTAAVAAANRRSAIEAAKKRQQLLLDVLPPPIRNLLTELYLRAPNTVGIFRKSPNAKHCKELRLKLERDGQSSIRQFQVTVVASVFKEWLRSLPDCLLMSRLYVQWIDVAKLIEPLYQHHHEAMLDENESLDNQDQDCRDAGAGPAQQPLMPPQRSLSDTGRACLRLSMSSPLTDNNIRHQPMDSHMVAAEAALGSKSRSPSTAPPAMSKRALVERHSECIHIVRQLLDALNETNLLVLRAFICVLWHIAKKSDLNKMSASNLGVCVGQSLLNDDRVTGNSSLIKGHRRSRSQCTLLSSTLSLVHAGMGNLMDTSSAQETAKYVPMLVAFLIENAPALFGQDVINALVDANELEFVAADKLNRPSLEMVNYDFVGQRELDQQPNEARTEVSSPMSTDSVVDHHDTVDIGSGDRKGLQTSESVQQQSSIVRRQIRVETRNPNSDANALPWIAHSTSPSDDSDEATTTSILIVNAPKRPAPIPPPMPVEPVEQPLIYRRPPSYATGSTSSSPLETRPPHSAPHLPWIAHSTSSPSDDSDETATSSILIVNSPKRPAPIPPMPVEPVEQPPPIHRTRPLPLYGATESTSFSLALRSRLQHNCLAVSGRPHVFQQRRHPGIELIKYRCTN